MLSDWQRYIAAISRNRWLVLLVTLAATGLGVLGTHFLGDRYYAKAILWVETAAGRGNDRDGLGSSSAELMDASGWVELVTANAVLDSVVRELHLFVQPESPADAEVLASLTTGERLVPGRYRLAVDGAGRNFRLIAEHGEVVQRGVVGDSIGYGVGFTWKPAPQALRAGRTIEFEVVSPYDASLVLASALKVRLDPSGNFLRLQLKGGDPVLAAATLNAIAKRIVSIAAEMKRQKFEELGGILNDQYLHAQANLHAAEGALRDFQVRTAGMVGRRSQISAPDLSDARPADDPAYSASFGLQISLDQVRRDRRALQQALAGLERGTVGRDRGIEALAVIGAVQHSPELNDALQEYTRKEAELRAARYRYTAASAPVLQLQAELDSLARVMIPTLGQQLLAELGTRETDIVPRADSAVGYLRSLPPLALQQSRLERDKATAEELYTNVRQRYEAVQLALVSSLPDVRILDPAVAPQHPAMDLAPVVVLLCTMTGFGIAVIGVTVRDQVDPKVRYPEQVAKQTRLSILGAVPHANGNGIDDDANKVIEALRGLRLRVLHAYGGQGALMLTVTSPGSGEGKSFLSVNLALSFADAGYRTLLLDGDVRRGAQHRVLEAARTPGLSDILAGTATLEQAVHQTRYPGLYFISCGSRRPNSPELLLSQEMRDLMRRLRGAYSVVIVDSAPLAAGVDPLLLGTLTGGLLVVLRSGTSDLKMTASKLEVLDTLPIRSLGAVLNDVDPDGVYRYYTYTLDGYNTAPTPEEQRAMAVAIGRRKPLGGRP